MTTTYLVTGAAGFIGSNLCIDLVNDGHRVIGLDGLFQGARMSNLSEVMGNMNFTFIKYKLGSLLNERNLDQILGKYDIDVVVHLAAESHVDRSLINDIPFWRTQVMGTHELMTWAKNTDLTVFINQITDEVYGEITEQMAHAKEGDAFKPNPPYACSKAAQYFVGQSFMRNHNLPVINTFPVNNFGPRQDPEKLVPKIISCVLEGKNCPVMQSSHFQRDWLYVTDMIAALKLIIEKGEAGDDFNIGANQHRNIVQMVQGVGITSGKGVGIETIPDRVSHDSRYAVNSSKIRALGWEPSVSIEKGLYLTYQWYLEKHNVKARRGTSTHRVDNQQTEDL